MAKIKFFKGEDLPLEMHKVKIIQKLNLPTIDERFKAMTEAGNNTFLLRNRDVFLDMLTDSGVNAMSDIQQAAMLKADDSYAGSETFFRLQDTLQDIFQKKYFLPAHQGRACEHIIAKVLVTKGSFVPMNYHFTTAKAHITECGGDVIEIPVDDAFEIESTVKFKGNIDIAKLKETIKQKGAKNIAFVRMEAGTNLIGGQPISLANLQETKKVCEENNLFLVLDASLLSDNLFFQKVREEQCKDMSILEITRAVAKTADVIYFSGRKLGSARGGGICTSNEELYKKMMELVPLFEGFLTYGGMSVKEMEAMNVGLNETMDEDMVSQGPQFIEYMVNKLHSNGVPVVTPSGGLGCHINAKAFLSHLNQRQYPSGALAVALYIISGVRGMERGTLSEQRNADGSEPLAHMELLRLAMPRRVFTLSQVNFAIDRVLWLWENRELVGGLEWKEEPKILRFFSGKLQPTSNWQEKLVAKFKKDFGDSL